MPAASIPLGSRGEIFFVEHAHIHLQDGVVVRAQGSEGRSSSYNIPHLNTSLLVLGNGTSVTRDAALALAKASVLILFSGGGGTPIVSGTEVDFLPLHPKSEYGPTEYMQSWGRRWFDEPTRLATAKELLLTRLRLTKHFWDGTDYADISGRAPKGNLADDIAKASDMTELLAAEGRYANILYARAGRLFEIEDFSRRPGEGTDVANDRLDHFNYLLYGVAALVLHGLGISSAFAALHGKTRRGGLVFDVADLVKDGISVPLAFHAAREGLSEAEARAQLIEIIQQRRVIPLLFDETKRILCGK